jgi:hypothetical protein
MNTRFIFIIAVVLLLAGCKKNTDRYGLQRMNGNHNWHVVVDYTAFGYSSQIGASYPNDTTIYYDTTFALTVTGNSVNGLAFLSANDSEAYFSNRTVQGPYNYDDLVYNYRSNAIAISQNRFLTKQLLYNAVYTSF